MSTEKKITTEAKQRLSNGNWSKSIGGGIIYCCVPIILYLIYSIVTVLLDKNVFDVHNYMGEFNTEKIIMLCIAAGIVVLCLLFTPLLLGYKKLSYEISVSDDAEFKEMFHFFKSPSFYFKALRLYLFKAVYALFFGVVYYVIPVIITVYFDDIFASINADKKYSILLWIAVGVLYFISSVLFISTMLKQYLAGYILCDDDKVTVSKAISRSSSLMRGNRKKTVKLFAKTILWFLLCLFVLPVIFAMPYLKTVFAVCSKWIIHHNAEEKQVTP